jgi:hypothetical protein
VTDFITAAQTVQVESYRSDAQDSHGNDIDAWAPRIVLDGVVYEVQGDPQRFNRGPFDFDPGVSVNLKHIEGAK